MLRANLAHREMSLKFSKAKRAYCLDKRALRGLLPTLKNTFYPHYSFERANAHSGSCTDASATTGNAFFAKKATTETVKQKKGMRRGVMTDKQVENSVKWHHQFSIPSRTFTCRSLAKMYGLKHKAQLPANVFQFLTKSISANVMKIWQTLTKMKLSPVQGQVVVAIPEWRLATAVDLLCKNEHGHTVIVEIKTGYETYYHRHTSKPMNCLLPATINDCPANQHQLQLLMTREMYRHSSCDMGPLPSYIFHLRCAGIDIIPLQNWAICNRLRIFNALSQTATTRAASAGSR